MQSRLCVYCNKSFKPKAPHHLYCTVAHQKQYNKGKTWEQYFKSLLRNNSKERKELNAKMLMRLYDKQGGRCAISGVTLTKVVGRGQVAANCSIDRINAGREYTRRNIRLVCSFVNSFRGSLSDKDFRFWIERIYNYGK